MSYNQQFGTSYNHPAYNGYNLLYSPPDSFLADDMGLMSMGTLDDLSAFQGVGAMSPLYTDFGGAMNSYGGNEHSMNSGLHIQTTEIVSLSENFII